MTNTTRPAPANAGAGPFMPTALDILNDPALRPSACGTGFQTALDRCPLGLEDLPDHLAAVAVGELRRVWVSALLDGLLAEAGHAEWFGDIARALGVVSRRLYRAEFDDAITIKETTMTQPQMGFKAGRRGQPAAIPVNREASAVFERAVPQPAPLSREELEELGRAFDPGGDSPAIEQASVPSVAAVVEAEHDRLVETKAGRWSAFKALRERVERTHVLSMEANAARTGVLIALIDMLEETAGTPDTHAPRGDALDSIDAELRGAQPRTQRGPTPHDAPGPRFAPASGAPAPSAAVAIHDAIAAMPGDFTVNDVWGRAQEVRPGMARENVANLIRAQVDARALKVVRAGARGVAGVYRRVGGGA